MRFPTLRFAFASLLTAALLALAGCNSPQPRAFAIKVDLAPALSGSSLQVDLIGANPISDLRQYETYSVTKYWQPGDALRRDTNKVTLAFGAGRPTSQTLSMTDAIWKRWLQTGAQHLVVIVDLPGIEDSATDPRRLVLPLDKNQWSKTNTLEILIQESGARLLTPKKP